jgi:hypothetical protein
MRSAISELSQSCLSAARDTTLLSSDLQLLAISTRITELFYGISDIQTRIFGTSASPEFRLLHS